MAGIEKQCDWEMTLRERVATYGHRNWIVVADAAYPLQSRSGVETVVSNAEHIDVVKAALAAIQAAKHIRPSIYMDQELDFVSEFDAPGILKLRKELQMCFDGAAIHRMLHDEIIAKLDQTGSMFEILVVKSCLTIPYTSVFIELDCGYWTGDAEQRLREMMCSNTQFSRLSCPCRQTSSD
jgi:D-ribose pyranose/furanose isomerase RbsD